MIIGDSDLKKKQLGAETGLMGPSIQMEQGAKSHVNASNSTPTILLELVTLVSQIAKLDEMFDNFKKSAPDAGSEADKWHQVSVQALVTSRKYMVEQQTSLIQRLANVTGTDLPVSGNIALASPKEDAPVPKEDAPVALPQGAIAPPPGLEIMNCDQQVGNPQSG